MVQTLPQITVCGANTTTASTVYIDTNDSKRASVRYYVHQSAYSDGLFDAKVPDYSIKLAGVAKRDYSIVVLAWV